MNHINNPEAIEKGRMKAIVGFLGGSLATVALAYKLTTIAKQYVSLLAGVDRLVHHVKEAGGGEEIKGYFSDAWRLSFTGFTDAPGIQGFRRKIADMSPFLRNRFNNIDRDLKVINTEFKGPVGKAKDKFRYVGFYLMKACDLHVASVQWFAAYNWALNAKQNFTIEEARAFADDFVASAQGGARLVDIPAIQLTTIGKAVTPFFGPAAAAANTRIAGLSVFKEMTPGERARFAVDNIALPILALGLISGIQAGLLSALIGGGDDDDWDRIKRRMFVAMLSEPLSGIAVVQDIADAVVRSAIEHKPITRDALEAGFLRPVNDVFRNGANAIRSFDDPANAVYLMSSAVGEAIGMPVIQVYEDYKKMIQWNFGDEDSKKK
jgi:hypothetical protein